MRIYPFLILLIIASACATQSEKTAKGISSVQKISAEEIADGSYLTKNHKGNPVIAWTEGDKEGGEVYLYYAVSQDSGRSFTDPVKVMTSRGTRFHGESMNKVAFKSDGTVIAVFEIKTPTEENKYAGVIMYSQSFDQGKSWERPRYLHTDTSAGIGRSFFDLSVLPNGEVGAVWLDGRNKLGDKGSSVFFTSTSGKNGFTRDQQIGETICQCCRTDLYTDSDGKVHAVFRDILNDSIRDMVHSISLDTGKTFSKPVRISADNWVIRGCPHTGPDLVRNKEGLHFSWYTAGGEAGVYYCNSPDNGKTFRQRELVSAHARHPKITASDETIFIVWDEMIPKDSVYYARVGMQIRSGEERKAVYLSDTTVSSYFPQIQVLDEQRILASWTQEENKKSYIVYKIINFKEDE